LTGIEDGAEVNSVNPSDISNFETSSQLDSRDSDNRDRANHTGTQAISTVTGLQDALDDKLDSNGEAQTVNTINGKISAGTNTTLSGTGTDSDPYVINSSGGGGGGGIPEAPSDGTDYVRNNGGWVAADYFSGAWNDLTGIPSTFTPSAHTHAASDIISGTFDDARISESSVTQHEEALSITENQISDLGDYLTDAPSDGDEYVRKDGAWEVATGGGGGALVKAISVESPSDSENITMFYTDEAITITQINAVLRGSSSPSVTWTVRHNSDRSATGAEVVTSGTTTTSTSTGSEVTSFNDATIPGGSWVWLETTANAGDVDELNVSIEYTKD
jgi:hypothetical protein